MDILEIKDLETLAQKRVPKMFLDYVNSGSWTETTYNENISDFQKIKLRQRVAIDMSNRTLVSKMVNQSVSMPVAIAPTGLTGMQIADGEILAAQAAEEFGIPFTLSTMSVCSLEAVVEKTIPVGVWPLEIEGPHGITVSPDGEHWYLSMAHGMPYGHLY